MTIRPARAEELESLTQIATRSKAVWGYTQAFMNACARELTVGLEALPNVFVKQVGAQTVGFYCLARVSDDTAELTHLFVEPRELGAGYGIELLRHAQAQAARSGYRTLMVQSDPNAADFFVKAGGRAVGERLSASIPGRLLPVFHLPTTP
jgi:N-acetylglutamate synthase-like GNAT family acetyltransferase